jgi:hypothetical protein
MKDKTYADQCDELSKIEAQNNHSSWGRWFLEDGMLCTWVCVPKTGFSVVGKLFRYEIETLKLKNKSEQDAMIEFLDEKNWMGEKGLKDLRRAFKFLNKKTNPELES